MNSQEPKIIIIDDDQGILALLKLNLEDVNITEGILLFNATNVEEVLTLVRSHCQSLLVVITDGNLHGQESGDDGIKIASLAKVLNIPNVYILTANTESVRARCAELGVICLDKTTDLGQVAELIRSKISAPVKKTRE